MPGSLSILIVNWNSKDYLRKCLQSVRATCADLQPQVVVVDGGSFDGCREMLAADFPGVTFVQSSANVGFGRANNLGFSRVTGEFLLLLNPDTVLLPGALVAMISALCAEPGVGLVGARLLNSDRSLQTSCVRAAPTPLNRALDCEFLQRAFPGSALWGSASALNSGHVPVAVEAVSGAAMLLRSALYRQVGGFNPAFFMYGEDMDLCARIRQCGLRIVHAPDAVIIHHGGGSTHAQASEFSIVMMREAGALYMRLHHGVATMHLYRLLQGLSAAARLIASGLAYVFSRRFRGPARGAVRKWWCVLRWALGHRSAKASTTFTPNADDSRTRPMPHSISIRGSETR